MMHKLKQGVLECVVVMGVSLGLLVTGAQAQSGSLEPPGSSVDGSGNPAPTTQTQPSWDQNLPAAERFVTVLDPSVTNIRQAILDRNTGLVWERFSGDTDGNFVINVDDVEHIPIHT